MEVDPSQNYVSALSQENNSCWKFRSRLEKLLFVGIVVMLMLAAVFVTFFSTKIINSRKCNSNGYNLLNESGVSIAATRLQYSNFDSQSDLKNVYNDNSLNQNASKRESVCLSPNCIRSG